VFHFVDLELGVYQWAPRPEASDTFPGHCRPGQGIQDVGAIGGTNNGFFLNPARL